MTARHAVPPGSIRNVAFVGHSYSGKTTLIERLLLTAGVIKRMGTIEEGTTVSDYSDAEHHHRHSLQAKLLHLDWHGRHVNLVDTPGLADFQGHAVAALSAADLVAVVMDAMRGIESGTRRLMNLAGERGLPRLIVVNKIDHPETHLPQLLDRLREQFGHVCLPMNLPADGGQRVVNVFDTHDGGVPPPDFSSLSEAHQRLIEQIIEVDDRLMEAYLERGESFEASELKAALTACLTQGHLVPVCFVSARTGAGAEDLLHVLTDLCPSPADVRAAQLIRRGAESPLLVAPDPRGPVLAHVFKVTADPFVGKLAFFRVHSGTLRAKSDLLVNDTKKPVRIGHMFKVQGKEQIEVSELGPGDMGALAKIEELHFGSVLHDSPEHNDVLMRPLPMPRPMFGLAVELKNHADEAKFANACAKLQDEDPSFIVERIAATRQTVIRGLGELHLRVVLEKLRNQYGIELITSTPKTAYKETITARAEGHHRHKKQTGGAGQFGEVFLRIEPLPPGHPDTFEFVSEIVGGTVPRQFWPAVEKGVRQVMSEGAVAGYPMTGIRVALYDGKHHEVDSKEIAFVTAARKAFIDAVRKAKPRLLEPYVNLEVTAPSRYMGDIAGHIAAKRGRVQDTQMLGGDMCVIRAVAPLGELQTYSNELKSLTGGQGTYTMEYSHDEFTPPHIQEAVIAAYKPKAEEE